MKQTHWNCHLKHFLFFWSRIRIVFRKTIKKAQEHFFLQRFPQNLLKNVCSSHKVTTNTTVRYNKIFQTIQLTWCDIMYSIQTTTIIIYSLYVCVCVCCVIWAGHKIVCFVSFVLNGSFSFEIQMKCNYFR